MISPEKLWEFLEEGYVISQDIGTKQYIIHKTPERKENDAEMYRKYMDYLDKKYDEIFSQLKRNW